MDGIDIGNPWSDQIDLGSCKSYEFHESHAPLKPLKSHKGLILTAIRESEETVRQTRELLTIE